MKQPYRTPGEVEADRPTLLERLTKNKSAAGVAGAVTIVLALVALVAVLELPGLLIMHLIATPEKPMPVGPERYVVAPAFTAGIAGGGFLLYKVGRNVIEFTVELGEIIIKFLARRWM